MHMKSMPVYCDAFMNHLIFDYYFHLQMKSIVIKKLSRITYLKLGFCATEDHWSFAAIVNDQMESSRKICSDLLRS